MAVDQSAIARVVGIETKFQDLRGGRVLYLPQQIAVIGSEEPRLSSEDNLAVIVPRSGNW